MGMKPPKPSAAGMNQSGAGAASAEMAKQRYFRIPFVRPSDQNREGEFQKKG